MPFYNDGFTKLATDEYLVCRTTAGLNDLRQRVPVYGGWRTLLLVGAYISTGMSILLGTIDLDLWIAISPASISFLNGLLEYFELEKKIVCVNRSIKELHYLINWWNGLSYVEKRSSGNKNQLVERTEMALMAGE